MRIAKISDSERSVTRKTNRKEIKGKCTGAAVPACTLVGTHSMFQPAGSPLLLSGTTVFDVWLAKWTAFLFIFFYPQETRPKTLLLLILEMFSSSFRTPILVWGCLHQFLPDRCIRDPAGRCLGENYSHLGHFCAAVRHTGSVGLRSKMTPAHTKTARSLLDLLSTEATLPIWVLVRNEQLYLLCWGHRTSTSN